MTEAAGRRRLHFRCHVFCCTNERPAGHPDGSCAGRGAVRLRNYMQARAQELGLDDVRINSAGCLDRCAHGPTVVVYPDGVWYHCASFEDVDAILLSHLRDGRVVERLCLPDERAAAG